MKKIIKYRQLTELESFSCEEADECFRHDVPPHERFKGDGPRPLNDYEQYVMVGGSGFVKEYPNYYFRRPIFKLKLG